MVQDSDCFLYDCSPNSNVIVLVHVGILISTPATVYL